MDLRVEIETLPCRRLLALVQGLPTDAACHRTQAGWSHQDEMAARLLELSDQWGRLQLAFGAGKKVRVPGPVQITRPRTPERPKPIDDPRQIAAWFAKNG